MTPLATQLAQRYAAALSAHLAPGRRDVHPDRNSAAQALGREALAAGLQTLDLAHFHELSLLNELLPAHPPRRRATLIRRAGDFFAAAILPLHEDQATVRQGALQLRRSIKTLSERTVQLAATNQELRREISQRQIAAAALKKSERHYALLLQQSTHQQEQLRRLSRQILSVQEEERKRISRELHDVLGQTLSGINLRLAALKKESTVNSRSLNLNIAQTQRLVQRSVNLVHRFARELRPAVLDDLGLIPALQSCLEQFSKRTGIRTRLTASPSVEMLDISRRTALFRVAQEALTNVSRHAKAKQVTLSIQQEAQQICMRIHDNGRAFDVARAWRAHGGKRLGLLGMRERLEMVGGTFEVHSSPGQGTRVEACISLAPPAKARPGTRRLVPQLA